MPFSYFTPQKKETEIKKFSNPDVVDVATLNCDDFVEWLSAKNFSSQHCQAFKGK